MALIDRDKIKLDNDLPYKSSVRRVLLQAPVVDAAPVVHGRWEKDQNGWDVCSECKCRMPLDNYFRVEWISNYCPNCGAKMDLEG